MKRFNMIEPTLQDQTGHCYTYASSILAEAKKQGVLIELWLGRQGSSLFQNESLHPFFVKNHRKLQQIKLFYKLIRGNENIFIPIASSFEMKVLDLLLRFKKSYSGQLFLHFHQFTRRQKKLDLVKVLSSRHPGWHIMTSTDRLAQIFIDAGFKKVKMVPYPVYGSNDTITEWHVNEIKKPHLLYIGAAREDKGFIQVIDFIEYSIQKKLDYQFTVQCSKPHSDKYDENIRVSVDKLKSFDAGVVHVLENTLSQEDYWSAFPNTICFAVYAGKKYADSVSGIVLDAIAAHVPVVTMANTWMSDVVEKHGVGVVIKHNDPQSIASAVSIVMEDYQGFVERAELASAKLKSFHSAKYTVEYIKYNI